MQETENAQPFAQIAATDAEGLHQIADRLHDEYFDLDLVRYDATAGILEIPFRRIFHGGPCRVLKRRILYRVVEVDVLRCVLRFSNVVSYEAEERTGTGTCSLNTMRYDAAERSVVLECDPDCTMRVGVQRLGATYREIGFRGRSQIVQGLFWDSSSAEVCGE